ncbi:MAG: hypothetical protein N2Z22_10300 [Turneriella sp.]|nr:hypothetical protein [Turneriella sp.]
MQHWRGWVVALLLLSTTAGYAAEFGGTKIEYMNSKETNFVGLGLFTSNKRFDAEVEGFVAPSFFSGNAYSRFGPDFRFFFVAFSGYFRFLRTDKLSVFIGGGIMPWLPRTYAYHFATGMDFFLSEEWRIFYMFRYMDNNAQPYRYPTGVAVSFGFKYSFRFLNI